MLRQSNAESEHIHPSVEDDAVFFVLPNDTIDSFEFNGKPSSSIAGLHIGTDTSWSDLWFPEDLIDCGRLIAEARDGGRVRFSSRIRGDERQLWDITLKHMHAVNTCVVFLRRLNTRRKSDEENSVDIKAFGQTLPGVNWTADVDGNVDNMSSDWSITRGRNVEESLGQGWLSAIHPSQRDEVARIWKDSISSGKPYETRFLSRFADGSYRWQLVRARPVRNQIGEIVRWVGSNIDIDDERRAIEQQRTFEALVQHTSDGVAIFGLDHSLRFLNTSARTMFEVEPNFSLEGLSFFDIFVTEDRERVHHELLPELNATGRWTGEFRFRALASNVAIPAHYDIFYIYNENAQAVGIATIVRDLRERLRYEQGFRMLAAAGAALLDTLDYRVILRNIARVVVARFAPCCVIDEIDEQGTINRLALAHVDPIRETLLQRSSMSLRNFPRDHIVMRTLIHGEAQIRVSEKPVTEQCFFQPDTPEPSRGQCFDSIISVPIMAADGKVLASLTAGSSIDELGRRLNRDDLYFLQELAHRATAAIENARRYERERHIALTLQEAALPRALRRHYGLHVSAEYRPGRTEATIGGDWYDTLALDDGRFLCIVGDVVGNGLRAAVAMSKLRQAMQTAALINPDPNFILDAADQILRLHNENMYATALIAIYDPVAHATTFASAGHPGAIIINKNKDIRSVVTSGMMIGLRTRGSERETVIVEHEVSDLVVLYTDGIIEAHRDADAGMIELMQALREEQVLHAQNTAEALVNTVLRGQRATDDIAVLTLSIDAIEDVDGLRLYYRDVSLAIEARQIFAHYLATCTTSDSDLMSAELIFGELLGNVSRHAPGPVEISFTWENGQPTLRMIDRGPGYVIEQTKLPTELSESFRGLFLIDNYSKALTAVHHDGYTTTCAVLNDIRHKGAV